MFHFIPKSRATTWGRFSPGFAAPVLLHAESADEAGLPGRRRSSPITSRVRSRPTRPGLALAFSTSRASSRSVVETIPFKAPRSRVSRTRARVSIPSIPRTPCSSEVGVEGPARSVVAGQAAQLADDEGADPGAGTLGVLGVDAVVADHRIGHRHDLAMIGGVGEDLLVAGHARVEDDLAIDLAPGSEGPTGEHRSVFQSELGDFHGDHQRVKNFLKDPTRLPALERPNQSIRDDPASTSRIVEVGLGWETPRLRARPDRS